MDDDDFESLYVRYKPKAKPEEKDRPYRAQIEDVTQETYPWGDISTVYRTGENIKQQKRKEARFGDVALVLRHIIPVGDRDGPMKSRLDIQSDTLRAAFIKLSEGLVNINLHQEPIIIQEPYVEIYHCQARIQEAIEDTDDESLREELRLLQKFQEDYMSRTIDELEPLESNGLITFELVPFIFAPGSPVLLMNRFLSHIPTYWAAVMHGCQLTEVDDEKRYELTMKYRGFNGTVFGPVFAKVSFSEWVGPRTITDLTAYPLKYHPGNQELFESLRVRGQSLYLDPRRKDSVRKLVREHRAGRSMFDDVVAGKGRGLVFLLHGPPGSGKTMTAEVVAESLKCPLYYTTGGELGLEVDDIEKRLRLVFQRIERWGAVLLFDEADTFMAQRTEDNLERNALVSILLRMLEYQSGILFLTTNRIGDFDTAFYSRIHIRIEFEKPQAGQRTFIWARLAERDGHDMSRDEFERLGSLPMDGRRIKNVLRVASLLSKSRDSNGRITLDDVKDSLMISAGDPSDTKIEQTIKEFCG
ncbi:ATPase [Colletotrichum gloeosporioides Cg-14]|uniref:ATPase n=1 Tax=Colletotrichum gloeosporioides (strain Cg-14) TaxID=1237896 RepID=T0LM94_COLGC|nr:ATPase [Colletotrichum gloeosporioides Cg-14]